MLKTKPGLAAGKANKCLHPWTLVSSSWSVPFSGVLAKLVATIDHSYDTLAVLQLGDSGIPCVLPGVGKHDH